jgi:hypothetical protein
MKQQLPHWTHFQPGFLVGVSFFKSLTPFNFTDKGIYFETNRFL